MNFMRGFDLMTDKEKINDLYIRVRDFPFPECDDEDLKHIVKEAKEGFEIILDYIKRKANEQKTS